MNHISPTHEDLDPTDLAIYESRWLRWSRRTGIRVGDLLRIDGKLHRVSYHMGQHVQHTEGGSFHIGEDGRVSYSGSHELAIPIDRIRDTGEKAVGLFWFFRHDEWRKDNQIDVQMPCRVYEVTPAQ